MILKKHPKGMHVMQCKYCNHTYVGGPQQIRVHLFGLRGQGVEKCKHATCSETRKKTKFDASGSLPMSWNMQLRKNAEETLARFFDVEDIPHGKV